MADESLWRARLRWRWRGALLWPLFVVLTIADAILLGQLPLSGEDGTPFVPALLLSGFFNLLVVAVIGPLASVPLRRRRPDLPKVIAQDYTGRVGLVVVSLALLAGGLLHRPHLNDAREDLVAQLAAARDFVRRQAPAEFRGHPEGATTLRLDEELFRTCVPGPDPKRWFCVLVSTDTSPPGIKVDDNRESNASLNRPGGF
jgi:hypothetical protein